ncbi:hypothetical protein CYMTET_51775 [Cymbomonas tetramitiformis]|uniref:CCHC-type domain-containing protein n=1 Tax=Cymbomonas tetramitiformis TaxID=36881 RepID=A0AAE0ETC8_9CHLO|nr:hypothetical protein CYMTET_51775 [Cymbomonas tetramitiformis]
MNEQTCHRCGEVGHQARACTKPQICRRCGLRGHTDRDCGMRDGTISTKDRTRDNSEVCHNCGSKGHMARDCTYGGGGCTLCGAQDHWIRDCPRNGGTAGTLMASRQKEASLFALARLRAESQSAPSAARKASVDDQGKMGGVAEGTSSSKPAPQKKGQLRTGIQVQIVKPKRGIKIPASQLATPPAPPGDPPNPFQPSESGATEKEPEAKKQKLVATVTVQSTGGATLPPFSSSETLCTCTSKDCTNSRLLSTSTLPSPTGTTYMVACRDCTNSKSVTTSTHPWQHITDRASAVPPP